MGRDEKYTDEFLENLAKELIEWIEKNDNFWLGDFAFQRGFSRQRLSEFEKKNEVFADAYKRAKDMQESKLVRLGLSKKNNSSMAIFALKNVAGWRDKVELSGDADNPLVTKIEVEIIEPKTKNTGESSIPVEL